MARPKTKTPEQLEERRRKYARTYALKHQEKIKAQKHARYMGLSKAKKKAQLAHNKAYYWANREKELARQNAYNIIHMEHKRAVAREAVRKRRRKILIYYGGKCKCCGEKRLEFLQISHKHQNGVPSARRVGGTSQVVNIILRTWPKNIQVLCANCHQSIDLHGYCPHKEPHRTIPL